MQTDIRRTDVDDGLLITAASPVPSESDAAPLQHLNAQDISQAVDELRAFKNLECRSARRRHRRRRGVVIAAAALVVALATGITLSLLLAPSAKDGAIATGVVARGTFTDIVTGNGALAAVEQVSITPEVTGTVLDVRVAEGDNVEKGQLLFIIENVELDRHVESAQRAFDGARFDWYAAVQARDDAQRAANSAWQSCEDTRAQIEAARLAAALKGESFDELAAKKELDATYQAASAADSALRSAQQQMVSIVLKIEEAQSALNAAVAQREKRNVYAPISGQVVTQSLQRGMDLKALVDTGKPSLQIADRSAMSVSLGIVEADILKISEGQQATVSFEALPGYAATAFVRRIAPLPAGGAGAARGAGAAAGGAGGSAVVSYPVELIVDKPDPRLRIGMTAAARITVKKLDDVLMVNSRAVQTRDSNTVIYVRDEGGNASPVTVTIVEDNGSAAVIEGEVREGDIVVFDAAGSKAMAPNAASPKVAALKAAAPKTMGTAGAGRPNGGAR
jgi:HlyD family secretion protein